MPVKVGVERSVLDWVAEEVLVAACWKEGLSGVKMLEGLPQQVVVEVGFELQQ